MDEIKTAQQQLARMRGMTRYYHERFFADTRSVTVITLALLILGWWGVPEAFLLVPGVALIGANQTAFDASYLIFSRHYAAALENAINARQGENWLIAARMEDTYLFPLNKPKVVTIRFGRDFSWFGWMTVLYTASGAAACLAGLLLGWHALVGHGDAWVISYLGLVGGLTLASLGIGWWWFLGGAGEARLRAVIDPVFG